MGIRVGVLSPLDIEPSEEDVGRLYACLRQVYSDYSQHNNDFGITIAARDRLGLRAANGLFEYNWHIGVVVEEDHDNPLEQYNVEWVVENEHHIYYGIVQASNILIVSHKLHRNVALQQRVTMLSRDGVKIYRM